jgi:hypothetical protein
MQGNKRIAEVLQAEYGVKDLSKYEDITYKIERFTDKVSMVTIRSNKRIFAPVYAMFDRWFMHWYGDYGSWGFRCTWDTDIMNLEYDSPYYQLEKLESRERTEFDEYSCRENLIKKIKESTFYSYDLTAEEKARFDTFIEEDYDYIDYEDVLYSYREDCEKIKELVNAAGDEYEWVSAVRNNDFTAESISYIFGCEEYELYNIGQKEPARFFIILYLLSVVYESEKSLAEQKGTTNERN